MTDLAPFANEPVLELRRAAVRDQLAGALEALDGQLPLSVPVTVGSDRRSGQELVSTDPGHPDRVVAHASLARESEGIGTETSSRNSEVIHAGIYYPANSLMARFCVAGRRGLYAYCAEKGVPHINCGKLIVATNAQEDAMLAGIKQRAETNGVEGMRVLSAAEAIALEPNLSAPAPCCRRRPGSSTATLHGRAARDAENAGAVPVFFSPVAGRARGAGRGIEIDVGGADPMTLRCRLLVNSAGLHAPDWQGASPGCRTIACLPLIMPRATTSPCRGGRRSRG